MSTVTLILPLDVTTVNNPSNIRSNSGVTAGVTEEQLQERWQITMERSDSGATTERQQRQQIDDEPGGLARTTKF